MSDQATAPSSIGNVSRVSHVSRRDVLRWGVGLAAAAPALSACGGFSTSGGGKGGDLTFMSTQFTPVEESERFRKILGSAYKDAKVNYVTAGDASQLVTQVKAQVSAKQVKINLVGGLHGDLATLGTSLLEDLSGLARELAGANYPDEFRTLGKLGTNKTYYIPWAQATYVLAIHKDALAWLPPGADVNSLTYDQYLAWAKAARQANGGKAMFGFPGGPKGLLHRFLQGYLYPAFTGGQVSTFRSADAVTAWQYMRELWANCVTASANYEFMQEPLAAGEVKVGWDHVARLVQAPKDQPDRWMMAPAPKGPKGHAYMAILTGLAIPKGAPDQDKAKALIKALSKPATQIDVLRQNAFFPTVKADVPADLPPAVKLEADAVRKTQNATDALVALPPVGLGAKDGQVTKVFRDAFTAIVLQNQDIRKTLDAQAPILQQLINDAQAPCWAPDPKSDGPCKVG
jgi:multiple sugar transport system substrate-binding protein